MESRELAQQLWQTIEPVVSSEGMELVELEFQREPRGWVLRLYIDRQGGVTLADCTAISREVSDLLDVKDPIDHPYHLEVSSPGPDRPLRKPTDFERFAGRRVRVVFSERREKRRALKGVLLGLEGDQIRVDSNQGIVEFALEDLLRARLVDS